MGRIWMPFAVCGLFMMLLLGLAGVACAMAPNGDELKIEAYSAILMEPISGEILFAKNEAVKLPPASVTKLMVMLLTMEAVERGQIKLTDVITASPEACKMGGSQIWLEPGEQMTVSELLKAVCIVSANDASYALAEHLVGSEENFIALMNKRAAELGLKDTHYVNTTGLEPDSGGTGNITSAKDMARLAQEMIKYPRVFQWTGVWIDSLRGGKSFLRNTNNLVRFYRGCDGLKTGFTSEAGFCLVGTAKRDGVRLIAVAMKSATSKSRSQDISKMFNYGFSQYRSAQVYQGKEKIGLIKVFRGREKWLTAVVPHEVTAVVKRGQPGQIVKNVRLMPQISAPVRPGQKVGEITILIDGKQSGLVDLVAAQEVKRASFLEIMNQIFQSIIDVTVGRP